MKDAAVQALMRQIDGAFSGQISPIDISWNFREAGGYRFEHNSFPHGSSSHRTPHRRRSKRNVSESQGTTTDLAPYLMIIPSVH